MVGMLRRTGADIARVSGRGFPQENVGTVGICSRAVSCVCRMGGAADPMARNLTSNRGRARPPSTHGALETCLPWVASSLSVLGLTVSSVIAVSHLVLGHHPHLPQPTACLSRGPPESHAQDRSRGKFPPISRSQATMTLGQLWGFPTWQEGTNCL